jgi:hypothetical protein
MKTRIITAIPLILVNIVAVSGQYAFLREHLPWPWYGAVVFAAALESAALFLAYMAHMALMSLDTSMRLRLGAISFALLAGIMNYSHYASHNRPTFVAVATGIMSASSPWLWAVYSRRVSRDRLMQLGLIEPGAVRLGFNRWLMFPARSFRVYRNAAWAGIREPAEAISAYGASTAEPEPEPEPVTVTERIITPEPARIIAPGDALAVTGGALAVTNGSKAVTVAAAFDALGSDASAPVVTQWCADRGVSVTAAYVRQVKSRNSKREIVTRRDSMRAIGNGHYPSKTAD